jgi:hypothetical protein
MSSYALDFQSTAAVPYNNSANAQYTVTVPWSPGSGTTPSIKSVAFLAGSIQLGSNGALSPDNGSATNITWTSNNTGVTISFTLSLSSTPANLDTVFATFDILVTINVAALTHGALVFEPSTLVVIATGGVSQLNPACTGPNATGMSYPVVVENSSYPANTDFSARVTSASVNSTPVTMQQHKPQTKRLGYILSKLAITVTGTTTTTAPATCGIAVVQISITLP